MNEHDLQFTFKARYFTLGGPNEHTRQIWFVIHGYGQLAKFFIKKFSAIATKGIVVVAPEGLSRFYLENFEPGKGRNNDRVGATWMTKEARLTDIRNYTAYLDEVYAQVLRNVTSNPRITILGFSQGAATASRWALSQNINFQQLVLWSGVFPPDMDFSTARNNLADKRVVFVYGKNDPFLNDTRFVELDDIRRKLGIEVETIDFEGGHEINDDALMKCI